MAQTEETVEVDAKVKVEPEDDPIINDKIVKQVEVS
jgi:hypothetical protein